MNQAMIAVLWLAGGWVHGIPGCAFTAQWLMAAVARDTLQASQPLYVLHAHAHLQC
jgi:hypothetical protein